MFGNWDFAAGIVRIGCHDADGRDLILDAGVREQGFRRCRWTMPNQLRPMVGRKEVVLSFHRRQERGNVVWAPFLVPGCSIETQQPLFAVIEEEDNTRQPWPFIKMEFAIPARCRLARR
jgi:hypothetical protein